MVAAATCRSSRRTTPAARAARRVSGRRTRSLPSRCLCPSLWSAFSFSAVARPASWHTSASTRSSQKRRHPNQRPAPTITPSQPPVLSEQWPLRRDHDAGTIRGYRVILGTLACGNFGLWGHRRYFLGMQGTLKYKQQMKDEPSRVFPTSQGSPTPSGKAKGAPGTVSHSTTAKEVWCVKTRGHHRI